MALADIEEGTKEGLNTRERQKLARLCRELRVARTLGRNHHEPGRRARGLAIRHDPRSRPVYGWDPYVSRSLTQSSSTRGSSRCRCSGP